MESAKLKGSRYLLTERENSLELSKIILRELPYYDYQEACDFYLKFWDRKRRGYYLDNDVALLGCNDRHFLLTSLLGRRDASKRWLYDRSREVEAEPDDCLDLWARDHYKSTIITFAGAIQEIICDPEITIGLFSFNQKIANAFVKQVKREFEQNADLKHLYSDCLFQDPVKQSPMWTDHGFIIKRQTNPKEGTLEGWGLVTGQPTSKHYALRIYDDVVTRDSVTNPEMIKTVTEAWELSDNLGGRDQRKWHIGTRYSFGDTYGVILGRGLLKPRLYAATDNGKLDGNPVFLSPAVWEKKKKTQASQVAAQMLQNPLAGTEQVFKPEWLRPWYVRPRTLVVYILGDPSKGKSAKSDRTAIAVIGIDSAGNKYLLDGVRHRMNLATRWDELKRLYKKWTQARGVQCVMVGWERYGLQTDEEYFKERMALEGFSFPITELAWTREGNESKANRVERLQPDIEHSKFFLPGLVWQHGSRENLWEVNTDRGQIDLRALKAPTRIMLDMKQSGEEWRLAKPLIHKDEHGELYDLTRAFQEEAMFFPFGSHDDLIDAASRLYDMEPVTPSHHEMPSAIAERAKEQAFPDA
jgi:phage terminase large subunit-like protein